MDRNDTATTRTPANDSAVKESVLTLLNGAIDYAGLFPPAGLSMPEAVINYAMYRNSNYSWMLGKFVVPSARLDEFYDSAADFISRDGKQPWPLAVVIGDDHQQGLTAVDAFNRHHAPGIICDAVEIKALEHETIETASRAVHDGVAAYFELPLDERMPDLVASVAICGQRAKIRTGGLTPEAFPATSSIIAFVRTCLAANVRFKATAGLHHPLRCFRPLTYESDAPTGTMHGFLNLFLMTGFAMDGYRPTLLQDVMEEEFDEVFRFDEQAVFWRDEFSLNAWQIGRLRSRGIQSFGSCSFDEPIEDLQKLGVL